MDAIRKAEVRDVSRLAEILIFTKRVHYREIFHNDFVSFGEMQVLPLAQEYLEDPEKLEHIWVYDDGFVKGLIHVEGREVQELYVDCFFQGQGIGGQLLEFAVNRWNVNQLYVLEKNSSAIAFYKTHGFFPTGDRRLEPGTPEYVIRLERREKENPCGNGSDMLK